MGSPSRISNYVPTGVAQLIGMYSKPRGALVALLPVVLGITPSAGPAAGGTLVRIYGYNFDGVSSVTIGGALATGLIVGGGIITCYTPVSATNGAKDVVVTGPAGPTTLAVSFTYSGATSTFDPATLSLTGWWRASYAASPWVGRTSAGSSGTHDLSEATNPPAVGTAVNGFTPADFSGVKILNTGSNASVFTGGNGSDYSFAWLFYARTAAADGGATAPFAAPGWQFSPGSVGRPGMGFTTAGVRAGHYGSLVAWDSHAVACGTGAWHLAKVRCTGNVMEIGIDSGAMSAKTLTNSGAQAPISDVVVNLGTSYADTYRFDGLMLELMVTNAALSDSDFANIKSYLNARYALSL